MVLRVVLGYTWLERHSPLDFRKRTVTFRENPSVPISGDNSNNKVLCGMVATLPLGYTIFQDIFSAKRATHHQNHDPHYCAIQLKEPMAKLPAPRIYQLSEERFELQGYLDESLHKKFIRPSKSPAGSPIFFVRKKDDSLRPVVNYHELNDLTVWNEAHLPLISDLFDVLSRARIFTKIDFRNAHDVVRIHKGCQVAPCVQNTLGTLRVQCHAIWTV